MVSQLHVIHHKCPKQQVLKLDFVHQARELFDSTLMLNLCTIKLKVCNNFIHYLRLLNFGGL
jgi:hypothetical protein